MPARVDPLDSFRRCLTSSRAPALTALSLQLHASPYKEADRKAAESQQWDFPALPLARVRRLCITETGCSPWSDQQWGAELMCHVLGSCPNAEVCILEAQRQCPWGCDCVDYLGVCNSIFPALQKAHLPHSLRHLRVDLGGGLGAPGRAPLTADFFAALPPSLQRLEVRAWTRISLDASLSVRPPPNLAQLTLCTAELVILDQHEGTLPPTLAVMQWNNFTLLFPSHMDLDLQSGPAGGAEGPVEQLQIRKPERSMLPAECDVHYVTPRAWERCRPSMT